MNPENRLRGLLTVTLICLLSFGACGGDGDGAGGGTPTGPSPLIAFIPDRNAGANSIAMRAGPGSTASVLQLEIFATEVIGVQSLDFVLLVPNDLLRFDTFSTGDFIGASTQIAVSGGGSNAVTFDILRTAPSAATGSGVILTLQFTAIAGGTGRFDFLNPEAEDAFGLLIPGIDWIGGAVQIIL